MQLFFQVFRPERETKYDYKCNVIVNAQLHAKFPSVPLTGTNIYLHRRCCITNRCTPRHPIQSWLHKLFYALQQPLSIDAAARGQTRPQCPTIVCKSAKGECDFSALWGDLSVLERIWHVRRVRVSSAAWSCGDSDVALSQLGPSTTAPTIQTIFPSLKW